MINGMAWGQIDVNNINRGGWGYTFNSGTVGRLDDRLEHAGVARRRPNTVPIPVFREAGVLRISAYAGPTQLNPYPTRTNIDSTFDYRPLQANNPNAPSADLPNMARSGIGLQALFYMGFVGEG